MVFGYGVDEGKLTAEFGCQGRWAVTLDGEAAASLRAVEGEGGEDRGSSGFERQPQGVEVGLALRGLGQEVEDSTVMPEIEACCGALGEDVGGDPVDRVTGIAEAATCYVECAGSEVKHGDGTIVCGEKMVHEG